MENTDSEEMEEIPIFNIVEIKNDINSETYAHAYIIGRLFSHSLAAKYSFKACQFDLFILEEGITYHSEMKSEDCYTNALKWSKKYFTKIGDCLSGKETKKDSYYFSYKKDDNVGDGKIKYYLDLNLIIQQKDVAAFRLVIVPTAHEDPFNFIIGKVIELSKKMEESIGEIHEKIDNKEKELITIKKDYEETEINYQNMKKDYIKKFYLLLMEKGNKINNLRDEYEKAVNERNAGNDKDEDDEDIGM